MYRDASPAVFPFCLHRQTDRPNLPCASRVYPSLRSHQRRPLAGEDWLHEPKWDGIRFQVIKVGSVVWLYSRRLHRTAPRHAQGLRRCTTRGLRNHRRRVVPGRFAGAARFWHPCCLRHKVLAALRGILSQCGWVSTTNAWNLWRQPSYCCGLGLPFNDADG